MTNGLEKAKKLTGGEINDAATVLTRMAAGDTIVFSQDGDDAWFTKGDRAFVGNVIIELRKNGWIERRCDDEENYRGMSEYDAITPLGHLALLSLDTGGGGA